METVKPSESILEAVEEAGLVYVSDASPGIRRERQTEAFVYLKPNGERVTDDKALSRIKALAIPPAYEEVWICTKANGHLQATGRDARGRKQYRYHPQFREARETAKFEHLADFGAKLPKLHRHLESDFARTGLPKEKVLATVVDLLEKSLIRVGNAQYVRQNESFGLTTLRNRHVKVERGAATFRFLGKSGVKHEVSLHDRRLARIVKRLQDLPGQELFQYLDEHQQTHSVTSTDVNEYLRKALGGAFTAKDFRTWAASIRALEQLVGHESPATVKEAKETIRQIIACVAKELGNTPAICRKCYIHPAVLEAYSSGQLSFRGKADRALIAMIRNQSKEKCGSS